MIEYLMGVITGVALTIVSLLVAALQSERDDAPVEGIDGLDASLRRDLPTAELPSPPAGTVYTGSHRRAGPGRWLAHMGRTHTGRAKATPRRLP